VVLGAVNKPRRRVALFAAVAALALHLGGVAVAVAVTGPRNDPPKRHSQPLVVIDHVVDLTPPPAPVVEPPPPPPPVEKKAPPPKLKQKAPPPDKAPEAAVAQPEAAPPPPDAPEPVAPPSEPPPAAQAGQVVAADSNSASTFNIATGAGTGYAGGTTSASGTGTKANHTGQVGVGDGNGLSHARPPQLHSRNWPCGWPSEAEDLDIEETYVTVRASISAAGDVTDVEVLSDPGHGFGKRASLCARSRVTFDPALDAAGNKVAGKTPPLRIKFVRDEE
jgi:outer membrane biosynthesis protein TonB